MFFKKRGEETLSAPKERIWEIDALRGLIIFAMLGLHLYHYSADFFVYGGYSKIDPIGFINKVDPQRFFFDLRDDGSIDLCFGVPVYPMLVDMARVTLFIISGISCSFSKDNFARGVKLFVAAYGVSIFSLGFSYLFAGDDRYFIKFGILQVFAIVVLFYCLISKFKYVWQILIGAAFIALDVLLKVLHVSSDNPFVCVLLLGNGPSGYLGYESFPLIPFIGYFVISAVIGKKIYKEKKTLIKFDNHRKAFGFLEYLGRHSGVIYVVQMFGYLTIFYLIGYIFNLF